MAVGGYTGEDVKEGSSGAVFSTLSRGTRERLMQSHHLKSPNKLIASPQISLKRVCTAIWDEAIAARLTGPFSDQGRSLVKKTSWCPVLSVLMFLAAVPVFAVEVTLLGPVTHTRQKGAPTVYSASFPGLQGPATLLITNGDAKGKNRVSSALIRLNGQTVAEPSAFNQNVGSLRFTVDLQVNNTLAVELRSSPESFITITVRQDTPFAAAGVVGTAGGVVAVTDPSNLLFGVTLTIPPGALDASTLLSITPATTPPPLLSSLQEAHFLPAFRLQPSGLQLHSSATLRVPYSDTDADGIIDGTTLPVESGKVFANPEDTSEFFDAMAIIDRTDRSLRVATDHFSIWLPWFGRWIKNSTVHYFVESLPANSFFSVTSFSQELNAAFNTWSAHLDSTLIFTETQDKTLADIVVRNLDLCTFTSWQGKWCQAYATTSFLSSGPSEQATFTINFNINANSTRFPRLWVTGDYANFPPTVPIPPGAVNWAYLPFLRTSLHEIGHAIGLPEYTDDTTNLPCNAATAADPTIMYYECQNSLPLTALGSLDIIFGRELYGLPPLLLADNFNGNVLASDWLTPAGIWTQSGGVLHGTNTAANTPIELYWNGGFSWADYSAEVDIAALAGNTPATAQLNVRYKNPTESCACSLYQYFGTYLLLQVPGAPSQTVPFSYSLGQFYRLRATAVGDAITCEIVDHPGTKLTATSHGSRTGTVALRNTHIPADFDNLSVTAK